MLYLAAERQAEQQAEQNEPPPEGVHWVPHNAHSRFLTEVRLQHEQLAAAGGRKYQLNWAGRSVAPRGPAPVASPSMDAVEV